MFGWKLVKESELMLQMEMRDSEVKHANARAATAEAYAKKCENLVDRERERIDSERERADRIADSLFQSAGLPATSTTVIKEEKAIAAEAKIKQADYLKEMAEIFDETWTEVQDDGTEEPVPTEA